MASCFENVSLLRYNDLSKTFETLIENVNLKIELLQKELILFISNQVGETIDFRLNLSKLNHCRLSKCQILIDCEQLKLGVYELSSFVLEFQVENDLSILMKRIDGFRQNVRHIRDKKDMQLNQFDSRTEKWSATQYFQFYSYLSQQQNMMQDYIRTSTYQRAVLNNCIDFRNKIVLDVGAGSGILSFFAVQAGAKKVYAVEASNMSIFCDQLIQNNKLAGKIIVVPGKIEEISIPEPVDVLISEPMGYMLLNERMLETYVHARKFLKPDIPIMMFPTVADLYIAPFSDEALYMEVSSKANFWYQQSFHGVDLSSVRESANKENFSQPIVDVFDINICMSAPLAHKIDFRTVQEEELYQIDIPLKFTFYQTGCCHGLAIWFDVGFLGSHKEVWLSTSPTEPLTHWYQVRCLFLTPLFVYEGQTVLGRMSMNANPRQSYDVDIELSLPGTTCKVTNSLDLKNPYFRYTGQPVQSPPGNHNKPPTEAYFTMYNGNGTPNNMNSDFNMQSSTTMVNGGGGVQYQKTPVSWSGDSFTNQSPQSSYGLLQTQSGGTVPTMPPFSPKSKSDEYDSGKWANKI